MDLSSVLAYKSLFFLSRASGTKRQYSEGKKYTALSNATRCAITASQTVVPLFAVSECLSKTAASPSVKNFASNLSSGNLKNIAMSVSGSTTSSALGSLNSIVKGLSKLGLVGNIVYALAKCADADEIDKTEVFMQAAGNCAGMYLFENIYSKVVQQLSLADVTKTAKAITSFGSKIPVLKSVSLGSILLGIGFVAASLIGCSVGQKIGQYLFDTSKSAEIKQRKLIKKEQEDNPQFHQKSDFWTNYNSFQRKF